MTQDVTIAPREICSRMHTFMLETSRAAHKEDKDSLVVQTQGGHQQHVVVDCILISSSHPPGHVTILRHLLSADSRNERLTWCDILNKALENLRAWDIVTPRWVELVNDIIILLFHDFHVLCQEWVNFKFRLSGHSQPVFCFNRDLVMETEIVI